MAHLDSITSNLKFKTLSSCRTEPILVLGVFIIFVNILTSKSATVEISQLTRHRNVSNDKDLEENTTHSEQYAPSSYQINKSLPTSVKLPTIADSTSDIQSKSSSSTLESIVLSHTEPDLDNRINLSDTNSRNISNQSYIKNLNLSNKTFTTTPQSTEDDEELRNYLQPTPDLVDETTTLPSVERVETNVPDLKANIKVSGVDTTTTSDSTLHVLQSSKFSEAGSRINHSHASNTTQFPILSKAFNEQVAQFERRQASLTTRPNDIDKQSEIKPFFGKNSPIPQLKDFPKSSSIYPRVPSNSALPNASLAELLYIIRHLNLSSGRSNPIDFRPVKPVEQQQPQQQQLKPVNWLQEEISRRYNIPILDRYNSHISQELNTAESSANKVDQPILRKDSSEWGFKLKDEGVLKFKSGNSSSHKRISQSKEDIPQQLDKDRVSSKNSKYLLVSPYTGNFDSGISLKNFPLNKIIASPKNPSMDNNQKFYDRFNKENLSDDSRFRKGPQSASTNIYYATDTAQPKESGSNLSNKTSQGKLKIKSTVPSKNTDKDDDVRSKRHERNSVDKKGSTNEFNDSHRLQNESNKISKNTYDELGENIQTIRANHVKDNRRDSLQKDNHYENFKGDHFLTNHRTLSSSSSSSIPPPLPPPPPMISSLPLPSFSSQSDYLSSLGVDKFPFHKISDHQMNTLPLEGFPFIGDSHKKSLYQIQENGLNFHDDLLQPLTVGELAHEHSGTPFRLRSPMGENYNIGSGGEFNLTQESNNYDDYLYLPYNKNQHQSDSTGFKFDDDLKKKLAIKTIEAMTKDPDLSISIFDNINQLNQIPSSNSIPIQKLYPNLIDSSSSPNNNQMPYYQNSNQASITNPLQLNMLPVATIQDQVYTNNPSNHDHLKKNSSSPINLVVSEFPYRWALSRMPDLIPIPLAATVPGYLIRLSNGQILAAALTNSFSIQGIQKGPHGYKNYLNHRLKRLIKTGSGQKQSTSYGTNHEASDSSISSIVLQAPQRYTTNSNKESSRGGGLFSRGVLSQLGLIRSNQRSNSTTREPNRINKPNKHKLIKLTNTPNPAPSFTDQELASLPVASLNEPIFSFADESQLLETPDPYHTSQSTLSPIMTPEPAEMFQNDNTLALKAKLNQFLSLKNLFNEDSFGGTKKRRSPPGGFEPPTFWLTAKRASRLRHGGMCL